MGKHISYKGVNLTKPDNVSMNLIKRIIDECGKDYSIRVQSVVDLLASVIDEAQKDGK